MGGWGGLSTMAQIRTNHQPNTVGRTNNINLTLQPVSTENTLGGGYGGF